MQNIDNVLLQMENEKLATMVKEHNNSIEILTTISKQLQEIACTLNTIRNILGNMSPLP